MKCLVRTRNKAPAHLRAHSLYLRHCECNRSLAEWRQQPLSIAAEVIFTFDPE